MSRVGEKPVIIPEQVTVKIDDGVLRIAGDKGELKLKIRPEIKINIKDDKVFLIRQNEDRLSRSLHGLTRTLVANAVEGVVNGFSKTLQLVGTGYRVSFEGETLVLLVGFSHPLKIEPPAGIKFEIEGNDKIKIMGIDKALVGQVAARIRAMRPPEPYKGKGIRYQNEEVKLKPGKAGKTGAAGVAEGEK